MISFVKVGAVERESKRTREQLKANYVRKEIRTEKYTTKNTHTHICKRWKTKRVTM